MIKVFNLISLLIAVSWLSRDPSWEPLLTSFTLFSTYLYQEVKLHRNNLTVSPVLNKMDAALIEKFKLALPSDGIAMNFLKEHDLGCSFNANKLTDIDDFINDWANAEHEFTNTELEAIRSSLLQKMMEFRDELSIAIHPKGSGWFDIGLRDFEDRPEMFQLKEKLNSMATEIYKEHQSLIRASNRLINQ
ncbi:hypothetical protein P0C22_15965 [Plesiomonas shigelloides]|uniref:hypothetical protein n=1 Tax=Plesiomonas shigelloides TaxID=703 RepID=UPI0012624096|nr:hypothetical protein [Plesiomonas shigelloides]KAB7707337.1 hypothetical protein GBN32_14110 [Plesiomonas shigelloides]